MALTRGNRPLYLVFVGVIVMALALKLIETGYFVSGVLVGFFGSPALLIGLTFSFVSKVKKRVY